MTEPDDTPVWKDSYEMEQEYQALMRKASENTIDLGDWLPSLRMVRPLTPGELCFLIAETGMGKSMALQNIAVATAPEDTLFFEMELPAPLMFERFLAHLHQLPCQRIAEAYERGESAPNHRLDRIYVCDETGLTVERMEKAIRKFRATVGKHLNCVYVDYIGLMESRGKSRYERVTHAAQDMKTLAKRANVVVIAATQMGRQEGDVTVHLHSARDSGAIEESCGVMLGMWRDKTDATTQWVKVLKNTKGQSGLLIECAFDGARMTIKEKEKNLDASYPQNDEG